MKSLFITAALLCCITAFSQRISIQPSILDFRVGTSDVQSQVIKISNLSEQKTSFIAYMADWLRDSTGGHQYFRPDTLANSCASWVQLSKTFFEVAPGQTEELIVRITAPTDPEKLKQMKWAMLFLQSAEEKDSASTASKSVKTEIKEVLRIGIHIYETPPALINPQAKAISLKPTTEKNTFEFLMRNTGDVMLQCKAYLELTNPTDGKSYKTEKIEFPVFPNGVRKVMITVPGNIPKGKYSALAVLDIGEDLPLEGIERSIEVQ